jgi:phosphatidylglycerophosphate synthase
MAIPRQLPNAITVARIPLAVIFFVLLLLGGTYGLPEPALRWTAAILFIVGISTDWVDGYLARKYDIVSDFGKLWDPIADKLLTGAGFVGLAISVRSIGGSSRSSWCASGGSRSIGSWSPASTSSPQRGWARSRPRSKE